MRATQPTPRPSYPILGAILRCQINGAANAVRAAFTSSPAGTVFVILGGAFLAATQLASLYVDLGQLAEPIGNHWPRIVQVATALALIAGYATGARLTAHAAHLAAAPWLAVLPWPKHAQRHAISRAALWPCAPLAAALLCFTFMAGRAATAPHPVLSAIAPAAAFAAAYMAAAAAKLRSGLAPAMQRGTRHATHRPARALAFLHRLDKDRPSWAGIWALNPSRRGLALWWLSLLLASGTAACITLVQRWPWPSLITGALGGHFAFLATLRAAPLLSPVLRAAPIRYAAACAAMLRLPLALSLAWFICAAQPALAASRTAWQSVPGVTLGLLLLNALFAACLATIPGSRRQALLLHMLGLGLILQQGAEYGLAYGALAALVIFALAAFLVRQARRRFRANG
jgi:hypothetical protein